MEYKPGQLSILIVNWKSKDYLRTCLRSIEATCAELAPQIVVVDGGSFDGCGEMLAAEFPSVEFVQSPDNVGFGRSNNLGFKKVTGEYLLLLNPDTEVHPGAVQSLLGVLKTHPQAGLVGPRFLNADGSLQKSSVQALPTPLNQAIRSELLMRWFPRSRLWGAQQAYFQDTPSGVEAVSGAGMLLKSSSFARLDGFHPAYFMYAEDMDLCFRVKKSLGLSIVHVPASVFTHHGGGSSSTQVNTFSVIQKRKALSTYFKLNHSVPYAALFRFFQFISAAFRLTAAYFLILFGSRSRSASYRSTIISWRAVLAWAVKDR